MTVEISTTIDSQQAELFKSITNQLGTTPADALRMFIVSFNAHGGFPYPVRVDPKKLVLPFETEEEAVDFADDYAMELLHETQ